jgi:translation initiation factor IF-2
MPSEREAREIANKREQILREQRFRIRRIPTLEELSKRSAEGNLKELPLIIKADTQGSEEALIDALYKLSTDEVEVKVVMHGVGQITESDVSLAAASQAIIIGFNVRPNLGARRAAEKEGVEIRNYKIIYDVINDVKQTIEGMLKPVIKEEVIGIAEVRKVFKIKKVGTVAGCYVEEGKMVRNLPVRLIRNGVDVYSGKIASLKRFQEDVKEVPKGYECGILLEGYNDIKEGDIIECFQEVEIKRTLEEISSTS